MKFAFISDIHGNAVALEAVIADIKEQNIDKVYVLGDICYRGPEPKRSLTLIRTLETEVIKGNADEWVVRGVQKGEVVDQALELMNSERQWTVDHLDAEDLAYLASLPTELNLNLDGVQVTAFHATPDSLFEIVPPFAEEEKIQTTLMKQKGADVYVYAHIHKPYIRSVNGKIIMNIGSVGLPFDGIAKASYGLIETNGGNIRTSIQRVTYNLEKTIEQYQKNHYPNADMMTNVVKNGKL